MDVVVVESPAKAKTINKYLGRDFKVLASYGHVRDLPPKAGSVQPDADFAMSWQVDDRAEKPINEIAAALKGAGTLYLATDPDREGEAISWHIEEILRQRNLLDDVLVKRVVFHEITKGAIEEAFTHPRAVNKELVDAYLARRALDYLVGFSLSPVLWRKLPGSRSAGRVQSVALRLVAEREAEIEAFRAREFWSVETDLSTCRDARFTASLSRLDGAKLDKFALPDAAVAAAAKLAIEARDFAVVKVERKRVKRNPQPSFTTSTLQQEASRKLGFGATQTMRVAQRLYEGIDIGGETVGLITYMRTDSVVLSQTAIVACRDLIATDYGAAYVPAEPRVYKTKAKNAQEAHEAIRPTDMMRRPAELAARLEAQEAKLYELIWRRTVACEMAEAQLDQVGVDLGSPDGQVTLHATGSTIAFDGFLKVYQEGRDDANGQGANGQGANGNAANGQAAKGDERRLPEINEGEAVNLHDVRPAQHFTQPPPRYGEASLVKKMEELGIGRPSTYASILQVLQDRDYVRLEKRRFIPEDRGRLVTTFLGSFFKRYIEYDFTARMEEQLDDVSGGRIDWKTVLRDFWAAFSVAIDGTKNLSGRAVIDALDEELGPHFFPSNGDGHDPRRCPACSDGRLGLRLGKHGPFIGCANYPECRFTRRLAVDGEDDGDMEVATGPKLLGIDPDTGKEVTLRKGPYGLYLQLGEAEVPEKATATEAADEKTTEKKTPDKKAAAKKTKSAKAKAGAAKAGETKPKAKAAKAKAGVIKPKRATLPKGWAPAEVDVAMALKLLALPREVGKHPEDSEPILAGVGRFGPYVRHRGTYATLPDPRDVLTIGINHAVTLIAEKAKNGRRGAEPLRELGPHPADGKPINLFKGRYGPYVKHGQTNATIPKEQEPGAVTLDEAIALLSARATKPKRKPSGKRRAASAK